MNKLATLLIILLTTTTTHSMHSDLEYTDSHDETNSIIPGASYLMYQGASQQAGPDNIRIPKKISVVTYYTAEGDPIETIDGSQHDRTLLEGKLDPTAAKPLAKSYQIKFWPGIVVGFIETAECTGPITKGIPSDFITFFDKNGNPLQSIRYEARYSVAIKDTIASKCSRLDISQVTL